MNLNGVLQTIPSFTINKKEFFLLWTKNYILGIYRRLIEKQIRLKSQSGSDQNEIVEESS